MEQTKISSSGKGTYLKYWFGYHLAEFVKPTQLSHILMVHQIYEIQNIAEAWQFFYLMDSNPYKCYIV